MKELPKMYLNKIEKEITNNKKMFSTLESDRSEIPVSEKTSPVKKNNQTVEQ